MNHEEYRLICLSIKNDISFEEFSILCSPRNYSEQYVESIWEMYCNKPLDFVLYHDVGKDLFEYLRMQREILRSAYLP